MNGFLKARPRLFANPLAFDRGDIVLGSEPPALDAQATDACTVERVEFRAERMACRAPS
jgi:hypothetical protein